MILQTASSASTATVTMNTCSLPASPTLTNPDMILPYEEHEILSPTLSSVRTGNAYDFQFPGGPIQHDMGLMTPKTPIRYGNGTILSDIGEVTEIEGTPADKALGYSKRLSKSSLNAHLERSSLTAEQEDILKRIKSRNRQRHISVESMSTIRDDCVEIFRDVDDNVSVDDSVFQGDDEGSVANSDIYDFMPPRSDGIIYQENLEVERNDYPSATLCKRAERRLLNAKIRLNSMEGKLNLARSSTPGTKSGSVSSGCSSSTPTRSNPSSPRIETQTLSRRTPTDRYQNLTPDSLENSSLTSRQDRQNPSTNLFSSRFSGYTAAGLQNLSKNETSTSKNDPEATPRRGRTFPRSFILTADKPSYQFLQSLREDSDVSETNPERNSSQYYSEKDLFQTGDSKALSRSASLTQMKDIKCQMQGLKGKLSLLRERARDENVKRRSLQSLRTSSPFTVAEQWRIDEKYDPFEGRLSNDIVSKVAELNQGERSDKAFTVDSSSPTQAEQKSPHEDHSEADIETMFNKSKEINDEGELDECASVDTIYHDTMVSHEDREDAFDYEHFFLHSAMGTLTQERRFSFGSEKSMETTRGYSATSATPELDGHCRSTSTTTLSTMASFATANEQYETESNDNHTIGNLAVQSVQSSQLYYSQPKLKIKYSNSGSEHQKRASSKTRTSLPILKSRNSNRQGLIKNSNRSLNVKEPSKSGTCIQNIHLKTKQNEPSINSFDLLSSSERETDLETDCQIDMITLKPHKASPIDLLSTKDQALIRNLLASLGKCALGLREARTSHEACIWRSRLDAAREALEGIEDVI
ncbi:hypothetical protein K3495_g7995 [Podosphaera aphanis]|nr:hypothetical protein K3495_g7995 [Podosphaera aphanis]